MRISAGLGQAEGNLGPPRLLQAGQPMSVRTAQQVRADFDRLARLHDDAWDHNRHHHGFLLARVPRPCREALEIGCGAGAFSHALAARAERVLALDLSPEMIRVARAREPQRANLEFELADVADLALPFRALRLHRLDRDPPPPRPPRAAAAPARCAPPRRRAADPRPRLGRGPARSRALRARRGRERRAAARCTPAGCGIRSRCARPGRSTGAARRICGSPRCGSSAGSCSRAPRCGGTCSGATPSCGGSPHEAGCRRRLPVRRGPLPRERRGEPSDALPLQLLPPRGGGAAGRLDDLPARRFGFTKGAPARYRSSPPVVRTFCAACGTPLTYQHASFRTRSTSRSRASTIPPRSRPRITPGRARRSPGSRSGTTFPATRARASIEVKHDEASGTRPDARDAGSPADDRFLHASARLRPASQLARNRRAELVLGSRRGRRS